MIPSVSNSERPALWKTLLCLVGVTSPAVIQAFSFELRECSSLQGRVTPSLGCTKVEYQLPSLKIAPMFKPYRHLVDAIQEGTVEDVRTLLSEGRKPTTLDMSKACERGDVDIVCSLVANGGDVNKAERGSSLFGELISHYLKAKAVSEPVVHYSNYTKIMQLLLNAGADVNKISQYEWLLVNPIPFPMSEQLTGRPYDYDSPLEVRMFYKAPPLLTLYRFTNLIMQSKQWPWNYDPKPVIQQTQELVELLLDKTDFFIEDSDGKTLLFYAAEIGDDVLVRKLLERKGVILPSNISLTTDKNQFVLKLPEGTFETPDMHKLISFCKNCLLPLYTESLSTVGFHLRRHPIL